MAEFRCVSWPWSSLRLRLSASRSNSEDTSSVSRCSPSPSAKEVCTPCVHECACGLQCFYVLVRYMHAFVLRVYVYASFYLK